MYCGSDMDLHFLHPKAKGTGIKFDSGTNPGYFSVPWDCYYKNSAPVWGQPGTQRPYDASPNLIRVDNNGVGPEIITMKSPQIFQNGDCYRVGVHYFDDQGFGPAAATLKVYVNGKLAWKNATPAQLNSHELWDAAKICWSNTPETVTIEPLKNADGSNTIFHGIEYNQ
jgi:hypothetical protein